MEPNKMNLDDKTTKPFVIPGLFLFGSTVIGAICGLGVSCYVMNSIIEFGKALDLDDDDKCLEETNNNKT